MRALLAAAALAFSAPLAAHELPEWRPVDAETGQIRDVEGLEALAADFPDSGSVRLRMLNAQLGEGDVEAVLASLAWLKERGYVFSAAAQAQVPQLLGEENAEAARALLIAEAEVIEASEVIAEVPAEAGLIESVSVHADDVMFVTSVTGNALHLLLRDNGWIRVPVDGTNDLSGIVVEPDFSAVWVASADLDDSGSADGQMTGLLALGEGVPLAFATAPEGAKVSDLSIADNGTVYASNPIGGDILRKGPGLDASLDVWIHAGTFRSPQGSAISADGSRLYLSDYRYGLAMVDIESGAVSRLASDVAVLLDGVDGLWRHGNELIAVQNGTSPMRISAFTLSENGTRIVAARILEQGHPDWTEPLGGSISGDALVYVGTGQWDRYENGVLREGMEAIPTQIRRLPLGMGEAGSED